MCAFFIGFKKLNPPISNWWLFGYEYKIAGNKFVWSRDKIQNICIALFIIISMLCYLVYRPGLTGAFVLDDSANINQAVVTELSWDSLYYASQTNTSGMFGRSVSAFTFALSGYFDPSLSTAYYFKLHNIFIHILCGLLLFSFSYMLIKRLIPESYKSVYIALVATSLWLLHPFSVSTVLYSVQRMAQLSAFFSIVSLLIYCYARNRLGGRPVINILFLFVFFPAVMILGVLSKENAVTTVLIVLLCELLMFRFRFETVSSRRVTFSFLFIFVVLPVFAAVIYFFINPARFINYSGRDFNMIERVYTQLHVVPYYIRLIVVPDIGEMSLYHDDFPIQRVFDLQTALLLFFIISLFAVAVYCRKKRPIITFGLLWFFICHLLESTVISLEIIFEHRNYLALYGFVLIIAYFISEFKNKAAIFISILVMGLYATLTFVRADAWKSPETMVHGMVVKHPESVRANLDYGNVLLTKNRLDEGREYIDKVRRLQPENAGVYIHLLLIDCHQNTIRETTDEYFQKANNLLFEKPIVPYHLATIEYLAKRVSNNGCPNILDYKKTKQLLNSAIDGGGPKGILNLFKARLEVKLGDYNEAISLYNIAFKYSRNAVRARIIKDILYYQVKLYKFDDAVKTLERAKIYSENEQNITYLITDMRDYLKRGQEMLSPLTSSWLEKVVSKKFDYNSYLGIRHLPK